MTLQQEAGVWHTARFPNATAVEVALKGAEELGEVASAVNSREGEDGRARGSVEDEAADVVICMMVLLERWVPGADLLEGVRKKLAILTDPHSGHRSAALQVMTTHRSCICDVVGDHPTCPAHEAEQA